MPAFAVGRTQQLVLLLHQLADEKQIPNIPIFVDSPLALNVTEVHRDHPECFNEETYALPDQSRRPVRIPPPAVRHASAAESKKLNDLHGPFVVISASGMCEAGPHSAPLAQQYRRPAEYRADHRFPGAGHARAEAGGEVAGGPDLRRTHAGAGRDFQPRRVERAMPIKASCWSGSGRWLLRCARCSWCMEKRPRRPRYAACCTLSMDWKSWYPHRARVSNWFRM